jgi:starch phosphorylase
MVQPIGTFTVVPALPHRLRRLRDLAYNLQWSWEHEIVELFRRLSPELWEASERNPVRMLGMVSQERLDQVANDDAFLAHLERVWADFDRYMTWPHTWYRKLLPEPPRPLVAYFSMEFGLAEALPIYSGGLGILAGDHLKSASDLGVDLVGIGLLYQEGYFRQRLNPDGWQEEYYPVNDFAIMPVVPLEDSNGEPLAVTILLPGRQVTVRIWRVNVGRVALLLLDTNVPGNAPEDHAITDRLYGGDLDMRIRQEIVLGMGGLRALDLLNMPPDVCHLNEGHSAFLILERIRTLREDGQLSFAEAREVAKAGTVFTTHTPVPAGIDRFPRYLMERYFGTYCQECGISMDQLMALGREDPADPNAPFSPTMLALRLSTHANGVSRLHGVVSRRMFQPIWPGVPDNEVPISSVTNGVHDLTFLSAEMANLYERYLGPRWREEPGDQTVWVQAESIPEEELWRTHERARERLVAFARQHLRRQLWRQGASPQQLEEADEVLDPQALTIGFGRRFTTYKRATLLLRNPERLARLLNQPGRPVQIIYAGKAHPADEPAKRLIRDIVHLSRRPEFRHRLVFLEDYDIGIARYMVQGADLWLNTPRRTLEASGTSGMKAAANGSLNVSILDGWWAEAYQPEVGWAISRSERFESHEQEDEAEAEALYNLLEREVVPLFYDRSRDGLPRRWIARMKAAIQALCPIYNSDRMVTEYVERFYLPAAEHVWDLSLDGMARAKQLAAWVERVRAEWPRLGFEEVRVEAPSEVTVGTTMPMVARVRLGGLTPDDVWVEAFYGVLDGQGQIDPRTAGTAILESQGEVAPGVYEFVGAIPGRASGSSGYTVRLLPRNTELVTPYELQLVCWASG